MPAKSLLMSLAAMAGLTGAVAPSPPADPANKQQVCRAAARQLGTRIRTPRRCRSAEQWQQDEDTKGGLPVGAQVTPGQNDGKVIPIPQ